MAFDSGGGVGPSPLNLAVQFQPLDPAATNSAVLVMMGLGATLTYTPTTTGPILVFGCGNVYNNTVTRGSYLQLMYGTGIAPANGAALVGTKISTYADFDFLNAINQVHGFSLVGFIAAGTVAIGVPLWFDYALAVLGGGTSTAFQNWITIMQLA